MNRYEIQHTGTCTFFTCNNLFKSSYCVLHSSIPKHNITQDKKNKPTSNYIEFKFVYSTM